MSDHTLLVAALRDLYDDSQHMKTQAANAIESLQAECERLQAELAAAQKDASLFVWLADAGPFSARWQIVRLEWWRGRDGWSDVRGDALRSAIEAAMAQENLNDQ